AYAVSYYGAIEPDRVVKRNLIKYLIQAPLMGTAAIGLILIVPRFEQLFNLPQDSLVIFAAIISIVLFQVIVSLAKPLLDVLSDWEDRREVAWLQRLDERLLTRGDEAQLLENILAAMCDLLRSPQGFVLVAEGEQLKVESSVGARAAVLAQMRDEDVRQVVQARQSSFTVLNGVWLRPLVHRESDSLLGVLGIASTLHPDDLGEREREVVERLTRQAERTLEDRQLQAVITGALQELRPEIESLQRYRSHTPYVGSARAASDGDNKISAPEFPQWVHDALKHYWGGPKLSESPLLGLQVVRDALSHHEQSPTKALRSVLLEAIELLRPPGEPDLHAREWVLYNILHLKFIEGRRIREIAERLAMSESDLYRKQRVAIEEVARTLATMEQQVVANGNGTTEKSALETRGESRGLFAVSQIFGMKSSRLEGFYRRPLAERAQLITEWAALDQDDVTAVQSGGLAPDAADTMVENAVGVFSLPLGIATNFLINGEGYLIPMVIEEPSVIAACSFAAKLARSGGGFQAWASEPLMISQIQVLDVPDFDRAAHAILVHKHELMQQADATHPSLVARGGGARDIEVRRLMQTAVGPMLIVHLVLDVRDAMGANIVNTAAEALAPTIEQLTGGRVLLRILSNLSDRRMAGARCRIPFDALATDALDGRSVAEGIVAAWAFADADPYRAATHNKGVMNGIDAVLLATGNDWRAIEAGAHAYAARDGQYRSMTTWTTDDGQQTEEG
ncbi:MAG: hydroxymethylglutaryl-CoA reductase, degradative, partial [Chloroflexi bacterium]|nr:hydroxymethylglutaryl-CoA reductase, degradative [Chloroflexota bacterium]